MSIDEQIALLESEKRTSHAQYERQINALRQQKQQTEDVNDDVELAGGRRVIRTTGKPASQMIIEDRGSY